MRQTIRSGRLWASLILLSAMVAVFADVGAGNAGTTRSSRFYANCMAPFVSYPPEKRTIFEHECRVRAEVVANVTPAEEEAAKAKLRATWPERRAAAEAAEAATPPLPRRTGLDTDAEGPIGTSQSFAATGNWIGEVNGQWFQVYAGARLIPGTTTAVASELFVFSLPASLRSEEHPRPCRQI